MVGQGRKRRWTSAEKKSAKVGKRVAGEEDGKDAAAVHMRAEATEDEDQVGLIKKSRITRSSKSMGL